jgi:hypothetical protein
MEINISQSKTSLDGLRPKLICIPTIKKQFSVPVKQLFGQLFERTQSKGTVIEVIQVTRIQLPIIPAFAISTYKAHGLTMNKIVVDLQVPAGPLQVASVHVPVNRVKRVEDVAILRPVDMNALKVRSTSTQDAKTETSRRIEQTDRARVYFFYFSKLYK